MRTLLSAVFLIASGLSGPAASPDELPISATKQLRVDVAAPKEKPPLVLGVNNGPEIGSGTHLVNDLASVGLTNQFHRSLDRLAPNISRALADVGISEIRTHDFMGPCDWYTIFPDWSADPELEASYHFQSSDEKISRIVQGGFAPYFRLGVSWNTFPANTDAWRVPPGFPHFDPAKWASICKHMVMHYNAGWANGFHYSIRYWEIWNEPDYSRFWKGTAEQYWTLYEQTARALKAYDPSLKVGGCGLANLANKPYYTKFIKFCSCRNVPLDFYSWHIYNQSRREYLVWASRTRETLDQNGFKATESHCTEWNVLCGKPEDPKHVNLIGVTHVAGTLIAMRDNGVSRAYFYPLTSTWGLFDPDGKWRKRSYAFQAFHWLQRDTPFPLVVEGREDTNYAVAAARSANASLVQVLVSDMDSKYRGFALAVDPDIGILLNHIIDICALLDVPFEKWFADSGIKSDKNDTKRYLFRKAQMTAHVTP